MARKDYYQILGINQGVLQGNIRKAYRELVLKWHPDKFNKPGHLAKTKEEAEEKFKEINEAYEILSDGDKRSKYDDGENVSVERYGYDYGDKIPVGEKAMEKYLKIDNDIHSILYRFMVDYAKNKRIAEKSGQPLPVLNDYHLIRAQKLLQIINSYYYPKYKEIGNWDKFKEKYVSVFQDNGLVWMTSSYTEGWEGAVKRFRELIDFAREKLELPKLTDGEVGLIKIDNELTNFDLYNNKYAGGKHEIIQEWSRIRKEIYDETGEKYEKYQKLNPGLLKEFEESDAKAWGGGFWKLYEGDGPEQVAKVEVFNRQKLYKVEDCIKLAKRLIKGGEDYRPPIEDEKDKDKGQERPKVEQTKVKNEVREEFVQKSKTVGNELRTLISEAKKVIKNYEKLEAKVNEIEKYRGEKIYNEFQAEINELRIALSRINESSYRKGVVKRVEDKLRELGSKKDDLEFDEKNDLEEINQGNITDLNRIAEIENKIIGRISKKGFLDILSNLVREAEELVNDITKRTADKVKRVREGLYKFQFNSNDNCQRVFEENEAQVLSALNKLENINYSETPQEENPGLFRPEVLIPVALVSVLVIGVAALVIRKPRK